MVILPFSGSYIRLPDTAQKMASLSRTAVQLCETKQSNIQRQVNQLYEEYMECYSLASRTPSCCEGFQHKTGRLQRRFARLMLTQVSACERPQNTVCICKLCWRPHPPLAIPSQPNHVRTPQTYRKLRLCHASHDSSRRACAQCVPTQS